jgi:Mn2+/Fe2+ NRAMP family transporter
VIKKNNSAIIGAAFLMATSAVGPGFLNNTCLFTKDLLTNFGFVILISILLDIGAQINIWRIITAGGMRAQDLSNRFFPGLGYLLSMMVAFGGLAFNIGNIAGCGLGLQVFSGLDPRWGAVISATIALFLFWMKESGKAMDAFVKIAGVAMLVLIIYVVWEAKPPVTKAIQHTVWPEKINISMIVALVGGTVGGYISFAGAHRLLDANIKGTAVIKKVNKSAISGILITSIMRYLLFLGALGVAWHGGSLDEKNAAASVFTLAAGKPGSAFFGVLMWSAAITSVIGASFTSISFLKTIRPFAGQNERWLVTGFILVSTIVFIVSRQAPSFILVAAGAINGLILPFALAIMLLAVLNRSIFQSYRHPLLLQLMGWIVVVVMGWMGITMIQKLI